MCVRKSKFEGEKVFQLELVSFCAVEVHTYAWAGPFRAATWMGRPGPGNPMIALLARVPRLTMEKGFLPQGRWSSVVLTKERRVSYAREIWNSLLLQEVDFLRMIQLAGQNGP